MSEDNFSPWDDAPIIPSFETSPRPLFEAFKRFSEELSGKDIDSRRPSNMSRQEYLAMLALQSTELTGVLYRKNPKAHEIKVQAWLSSSITIATRLSLTMDAGYKGISQGDISNIIQLSLEPESIVRLPAILAEQYGVVLIIQPGYTSMNMDGCALKLPDSRPMIGITLRYNRYDNFWFTLVHELAHLCLHDDHLDTPIVDDLDEAITDDIEAEANAFARECFVPRREWRVLYENRHSESLLEKTCADLGVHPDIVAGLIRFAAKDYKLYPSRHRAVDVKKILGFVDV
ncbi:TPA: ImmA/IrrE family metallo-endopeptidase [Pseudomonas aeruginosa]|nr:ImmA/IrrE family metallo-endopeptidase [Pseudomonas aeruginosa]HCF5273115.1 ImmA/IrrE family metallo-endopeptidase [Pseudomonas aeruginosa]HCF7348852.1 ImmA/IrrE family metallo-endopeptidase [Pseudomonas aeruginosa]HCF7352336.1 ImmA/IrrE family metallo-endopeptidase [Pseudomonas aeruginosa]HDQ4123542.1 ImmA/IrrE family metallo-endopeptidase [Pseudomonas aeruginosa]